MNVSNEDQLILTDADDQPIGQAGKRDCHLGEGRLHRAFSLFLFSEKGELLLQQRAPEKPLWPGFWSNSCCSHPVAGETTQAAVIRRAGQELAARISPPQFVYKFKYHARFGNIGSEHEWCHVFLARLEGEFTPAAAEIADVRFVSADGLDREMADHPQQFTPWFKQEWAALRGEYPHLLSPYLKPSTEEPA